MEKVWPPCPLGGTLVEFLMLRVKTNTDKRLPISPKVETMVSKMPSMMKDKVSAMMTNYLLLRVAKAE